MEHIKELELYWMIFIINHLLPPVNSRAANPPSFRCEPVTKAKVKTRSSSKKQKTKPENLNAGDNTFVIKRATVDGKNVKKMTKTIRGYVTSITPHSVQYSTSVWGDVKTIKF